MFFFSSAKQIAAAVAYVFILIQFQQVENTLDTVVVDDSWVVVNDTYLR